MEEQNRIFLFHKIIRNRSVRKAHVGVVTGMNKISLILMWKYNFPTITVRRYINQVTLAGYTGRMKRNEKGTTNFSWNPE
jgi:hypothetical protein